MRADTDRLAGGQCIRAKCLQNAIRWPRNKGNKLNYSDCNKLNKPDKVSNFPYNRHFFQPGKKFWYYAHANSLSVFEILRRRLHKHLSNGKNLKVSQDLQISTLFDCNHLCFCGAFRLVFLLSLSFSYLLEATMFQPGL